MKFIPDDAEIVTQFGDVIFLSIGNCKVRIIHGEAGFNVDYFKEDELDEPFREDQFWFGFDDLESKTNG